MANVVKPSDFVGIYKISNNQFTADKLTTVINDIEKTYIFELLGAELGTLFINDLDPNGVPQTPRFQNIYNSFAQDIAYTNTLDWGCFYGCSCVYEHFDWMSAQRYYESKGMKFYLLTMIYFDFVREYLGNAGVGNKSRTNTTNSTNTDLNGGFMATKFNEGIENGKAIQWYIRENKDDYEEFNGSYLRYFLPL